jgi:hypothetical protein
MVRTRSARIEETFHCVEENSGLLMSLRSLEALLQVGAHQRHYLFDRPIVLCAAIFTIADELFT